MKAPVLLVGPRVLVRQLATALQSDFAVTVEEEPARARVLTAVGAHLVIVSVGNSKIAGAVEVDPAADPKTIIAKVSAAVSRGNEALRTSARDDEVAVLAHDEYLDLIRYAGTRRYLASLLTRHGGSVTDAARGAGLKRESLHRLLRRHHMRAEDFRDP